MRDIVIGSLIMIITVLVVGIVGRIETTDIDKGIVKYIQNDEVFVEDEQGMLWSFYGTDFEEGQEVTMIIKDNGTANYKDDEIIEVR